MRESVAKLKLVDWKRAITGKNDVFFHSHKIVTRKFLPVAFQVSASTSSSAARRPLRYAP